jgi:hypothetical protein
MKSTYTAFISLNCRLFDGEASHVMENARVVINGNTTLEYLTPDLFPRGKVLPDNTSATRQSYSRFSPRGLGLSGIVRPMTPAVIA